MDNSSSGMPLRPGGLSNGPSFRRGQSAAGAGGVPLLLPPIPVDAGGGAPLSPSVVTVIVNKDENGYGMKVSGDNPVYVQSVKEGGAAEKAGLHSGDKIIKVNGVNVTQSTHTEVVALIKSATQVVLTVQQRPRPSSTLSLAAPSSPASPHLTTPSSSPSSAAAAAALLLSNAAGGGSGGGIRTSIGAGLGGGHQPHGRPLLHHHSAPARTTDRITSPQPVDNERMRQLEFQKVHMVRLMLEKEQRYVETLRSQLAAHPPPPPSPLSPMAPLSPGALGSHGGPAGAASTESKLQAELEGAERRVRELEERVAALTTAAHAHRCPATREVAVPQQVSNLHTHHRTKSSPDPLNMQNISPAEASKRLIASESLSDLSFGGGDGSGTADGESPRVTPPGTPPPPYGGGPTHGSAPTPDDDPEESGKHNPTNSDISPVRSSLPHYASTTILQQHPIISMEEDEMSDQEVSQLEDHGPFKSLSKLWEHTAHLAVFMNYVICNNDTSSLLFYLVTDLYKEGNAKEMKKWAYEIHSSFLVPGAPLRLNNVDENVAREIDDVLLNESDKEEILRRIFWKARLKAKEELNEQLADFQQKRTAGLGTLFGPPDSVLDSSIHDKSVEMKIAEKVLLPNLEHYKEVIERDNLDIRRFTAAAALVTVLSKVFGIRAPHSNSLLDRCPTFVSKDKYLKSRLIGKSRKVNIRGHHFVAHQYYSVTYCNHCQLIICGIGPQGYQCSDCSLNIHRHCVRVVEENCPGPLVKKERGNDRISKLMEKIRPEREPRRKPSSHNFSQVERMRRQAEEDSGALTDGESGTGERTSSSGRASERRPDPLREEGRGGDTAEGREADDGLDPQPLASHDHLPHHPSPHPPPSKPGAASINRSESYKERSYKERAQRQRPLRERRKTSDPNLSSKTSDVDLENSQGLSYNTNSGSSSNSSLQSTRSLEASLSRRSLDSPCHSMEAVDPAFAPTPSLAAGALGSGGGGGAGTDSDLDADADPPDWTQGLDEDTLRGLTAAEKKRQEVINELFHTERTHVRNLKVLEQVFYRPMQENNVLTSDEMHLLFANLEEMLALHAAFNHTMKVKRQRDAPLVGQVADLLLAMFDGPASENFQRSAAAFCARQTIALELLKERRRKDGRLHAFLTAAEGSALCRRLQLKDIIPTAMQRLTKYPLLFENLAKYTAGGSPEEVSGVQRAVERSKEILNYVNHAVREAEDQQRLADIQRRLDKAAFERAEHPIATEFKNLDLTKHKLVHEGPLTWRIGNKAQKLLDLHVLLLEEFIILLQREGERFLLKFHSHNAADRSLSPIIRVSTVLVRPNAVDNKALYLVNTSHNGAQIYDLVATSRADSKIWFRHISEAAEAYKAREGKGRRPEPSPGPTLPSAAATTADSTTPDVLDSTTPAPSSNATADKPSDAEDASNAAAAAAGGGEASAEGDAGATESASSGGATPPTLTAPSPEATTDAISRKLGEGSPSGRRRIEPLRLLTEESPLVQPSEVVVSLRPVLTAEPVLTPIERLRRQDAAVRAALAEKQRLVADLLGVPRDDFEAIADLAGEPSPHKDPAELVLAAAVHVHQLTSAVNECLRVSEEEAVTAAAAAAARRPERLPAVPAHSLQPIAHALNSHLTQLLRTVRAQEEERETLRRECQRLREQVHALHEARRREVVSASCEIAASGTATDEGGGGGGDRDAEANNSTAVAETAPAEQGAAEENVTDAAAATILPASADDTGVATNAEDDDVELADAPSSEVVDETTADVSAQEFVDALSEENGAVSDRESSLQQATNEEAMTDK